MKIKTSMSIDHKSTSATDLPYFAGGNYAILVPGGCCCCFACCCCSGAVAQH